MLKKLLILSMIGVIYAGSTQYWACDNKWKDVKIGFSEQTLCQEGDLITSVAMLLSVQTSLDPKDLNTWLLKNNGYTQDSKFVWDSIRPFGYKYTGTFTSFKAVSEFLGEPSDRNPLHLCLIQTNIGSNHWVYGRYRGGNTIRVRDPLQSNSVIFEDELIAGVCYLSYS